MLKFEIVRKQEGELERGLLVVQEEGVRNRSFVQTHDNKQHLTHTHTHTVTVLTNTNKEANDSQHTKEYNQTLRHLKEGTQANGIALGKEYQRQDKGIQAYSGVIGNDFERVRKRRQSINQSDKAINQSDKAINQSEKVINQ